MEPSDPDAAIHAPNPCSGMEPRAPNAALHDFLTAGAPENVSEAVLQEAGLHVRLVSRTFNSLHPPLLALTPNLTTTPEDLPAHLAALPPAITSLDLRGLCLLSDRGVFSYHLIGGSTKLITQAALAAIAANLPLLQELKLPEVPTSLAPALLTTLQACPALHTLHVDVWHHIPEHQPCWVPLLDPLVATRLRSLSNLYCEDMLRAAPPRSLLHLTSVGIGTTRYLAADQAPSPPVAHQMATLCAAAPALRALALDLEPRTCQEADAVSVLTALAALTDLTLGFSMTYADEQLVDLPASSLLQRLGTLTTLRSLSLTTPHKGWTPPEAGWLLRLTQLTSLDITFFLEFVYDWGNIGDRTPERSQAAAATFTHAAAPVIAEVASSAVHLPLLRKLAIAMITSDYALFCSDCWLQCGTPNSFYQHLAAATQLRHLCLHGLPLPPQDASLLTRLQHLTALQLYECAVPGQQKAGDGEGPGTCTLTWVAALPCLRHLSCRELIYKSITSTEVHPPCFAVGSLANLHTLAVHADHGYILGRPLEQLLEAVAGRLERLELVDCEWECSGAGVRVLQQLQQLTSLRVLDMQCVSCRGRYGMPSQEPLLQHLRLPPSLRHCYLLGDLKPGHAALQRLQAAYPLVAFRTHNRLDIHVW